MGGFCPGGFCPGGFCPRGILSRGILSGGFCPGGFCPRTLLLWGRELKKIICPGGLDSLAQKTFPGGCPGRCTQLELTET